jgi:hypothetical protein
MSGTESKNERERKQRLANEAKRKPTVTRENVDALMAAMTAEGRAHVSMLATHRLRPRPATWPR